MRHNARQSDNNGYLVADPKCFVLFGFSPTLEKKKGNCDFCFCKHGLKDILVYNVWRFVSDKNKPKKRSDVLGEINIEIENMWSSKLNFSPKKNYGPR